MGVYQILSMRITHLINITFIHNEHENQNMLTINNKKACKKKNKELR